MILGPETPIILAACTYSRFFSTKVEPRTVRAYWGQPAKAMAPIKTGKAMTSCRFWGTIARDRKSTRLNSSHVAISYAVFCLKKKKKKNKANGQKKKRKQQTNIYQRDNSAE